MSDDKSLTRSSDAAIAAFIRRSRQLAPSAAAGRLLFALDATASRQPAWDQACRLQGEMFIAAAEHGGLAVQLVWYGGFADFRVAPWAGDAATLLRQMRAVSCAGGTTQIGRVLRHALQASRERRLSALVFVGDCMEEDPRELYPLAGQLRLLGLPAFMFHEGDDPTAAAAFREIAALSGGAYCPFDTGSAAQLRELLRGVAAYASGGAGAVRALADRRDAGPPLKRLARQLEQR